MEKVKSLKTSWRNTPSASSVMVLPHISIKVKEHFPLGAYEIQRWLWLEISCGSDQLSIVLTSVEGSIEVVQPRWKLNKANWSSFQMYCLEKYSYVSLCRLWLSGRSIYRVYNIIIGVFLPDRDCRVLFWNPLLSNYSINLYSVIIHSDITVLKHIYTT